VIGVSGLDGRGQQVDEERERVPVVGAAYQLSARRPALQP
jgi:hypothetical protein